MVPVHPGKMTNREDRIIKRKAVNKLHKNAVAMPCDLWSKNKGKMNRFYCFKTLT